MQVLCVASADEAADIACSTCGQRYTVYYSRSSAAERAHALETVHATLAAHHADNSTADAHPGKCFNVPEWKGLAHMSGAALLSGAPVRPAAAAETELEARLAS